MCILCIGWNYFSYQLGAASAALGAIFGGAEGGPMAAFAQLVGKHLGAKKVEIKCAISGKTRSAEIPGIMPI